MHSDRGYLAPAKVAKGECTRSCDQHCETGLRLPASLALPRWTQLPHDQPVALCAQKDAGVVRALPTRQPKTSNLTREVAVTTGESCRL